MPTYNLEEGGIHEAFDKCRSKIQIFGGGFGNGKTAAACVLKALKFAKDYPGSNGLIARATYPKLKDTIQKEFFKWCPKYWIKRMPTKDDNTCYLKNGSMINFRYVAQQGKQNEDGSTTSNLLSATYDWIIVDQIEDPEFEYKDFTDLLGRLRGQTPYTGDDPTMPKSGPRFLVLLCNPTRNWFYRKIVKPYHDYKRTGRKSPDLIVDEDTGECIIEVFEGPTTINKDNLPEDFIRTLAATYQGSMRKRFLLGEWVGYEGLVYPQWDDARHLIPQRVIIDYLEVLRDAGFEIKFLEGYDYGLSSPSVYLLAFTDHKGNVFIVDGFYQPEFPIEDQAAAIKAIREKYGDDGNNAYEYQLMLSDDGESVFTQPTGKRSRYILADPDIFRRKGTNSGKIVGRAVADIFNDYGIKMQRGNNDIINGITKVGSYLQVHPFKKHPIYDTIGSPHLFVAEELRWFSDEINDYYWKRTPDGQIDDERPMDRNDHALDATKYMLSFAPPVAKILVKPSTSKPAFLRWHEYESKKQPNSHRYGVR